MRMVVTGRQGQVVSALIAAGPDAGITVLPLGRPELDLADAASINADTFAALRPDIVVSAAAYTAVDQAESDYETALAVNGAGAGAVAGAAQALGVPVIHISTDYVFDGSGTRPWREDDAVAPIGAYGRSKLEGERAVAAANADHAILRTSWVYDAQGKNFVRTMLRVAPTRPLLTVVGDQHGAPSYAPDIAQAIIAIARNMLARPDDATLRGIFHMAGGGETTWADFARHIFALSARRRGPAAEVKAITTAEYPTPARRPANSRLDCTKLKNAHGVAMPAWQDALERCMDILARDAETTS